MYKCGVDASKALKMCENAIAEHQHSRLNSTSISAMLISRRDRANEQLKDYHQKLIKKIHDHQRHFDKKLNDLLVERQQECSKIINGVDERSVKLRELKSLVEDIDQEILSSGTSESLLSSLNRAIEEIGRLIDENDRVAAHDSLQRLLDMEFEFLPQSDVVAKIFDENNSVVYLNSCGVKPEQLRFGVGREFALHQNNTVVVNCPNLNANLLYHVRVEAVNLNTNSTARLRFNTFHPNCSMAFDFNPTESCQYQLSCYLYDVHIGNSPIVVEVNVSALIDQLNSAMNRGALLSTVVNGSAHPLPDANVGVGRGYSAAPNSSGRSRIMENILKAPVVVADHKLPSITNYRRITVDVEPTAEQFQDAKNPAATTETLNSSFSPTNSVYSINGTRRYMGRLLDANDDAAVAQPKVEQRRKGDASPPRTEPALKTNNLNQPNEDWDADLTVGGRISPGGGSFLDTSVPVCSGSSRMRPDLTPLIKPGRGLGAKFVLNLGQFGKSDPVEAFFNMPIGCASNDNLQQFIICDTRHNAVKLYDIEGKTKLMIDGERNPDLKLNGPSAVLIVEEDNFVVKDTQKLCKFSPNGQLLNVFGSGLFKKIYGLAQDGRGVLLTLDLGDQRRGGVPVLFGIDSLTGKTLVQTEFEACRNVRNSKCYFMDCLNDTFVVSDLGASQAYICDANGDLKQTFGEHERTRAEPGKFNEPSGITMDAAGNILIGDSRNDRVQIWSPTGEYLGDVTFTNRIFRPSNIYLTADGHLIVMNYIKHFVSIYKLETLP